MTRSLVLLLFLLATANLFADEIRPGYLQLKETAPDVFSITWKVPAKGDRKLGIDVQLPGNCKNQERADAQLVNSAYIARWITVCDGGIVDREIAIAGLNATSTDVLLHMEFRDGRSQTAQLTPAHHSFRVPAQSSPFEVATTYTIIGIEHILLGVDHLLFVFALLLIVKDWRRLVATITAFTLAHSVTLAVATLKLVQVPQKPVEAVIALSILFLAMEYIHGRQGRPGAAARWPWLIAFVFGLLHGFGFAGALAEVGLPQQSIPLALVFFNVGVELGQLLFIGFVLLLGRLIRQLNRPSLLAHGETVIVYVIGGLSSFWLIERVSAF